MNDPKNIGTLVWLGACLAAVVTLTLINEGMIVVWVLVGAFAAMAPLLSKSKKENDQ